MVAERGIWGIEVEALATFASLWGDIAHAYDPTLDVVDPAILAALRRPVFGLVLLDGDAPSQWGGHVLAAIASGSAESNAWVQAESFRWRWLHLKTDALYMRIAWTLARRQLNAQRLWGELPGAAGRSQPLRLTDPIEIEAIRRVGQRGGLEDGHVPEGCEGIDACLTAIEAGEAAWRAEVGLDLAALRWSGPPMPWSFILAGLPVARAAHVAAFADLETAHG